MKKYLKNISPYVIVIAILVVIIIIMQQCSNKKTCNCKKIETKIIHKTDTIPYEVIVEKIKTEFIYSEVTVKIPQNVDTFAILSDYYKKRNYIDTIMDIDTLALIVINDSVYKNNLQYRQFEYKNRVPKIIDSIFIYNTVYESAKECSKWNFGIGGILGGNTDTFNAGVSILLCTPKKSSYTLSYDVINKTYNIGVYWMFK